MSYIGNNKIGKMYLGGTEIAKAYLGDDLVFQNGGGPTPPTPTPVFYDYLIFDGTAYIDTDIITDANASFRVNLGDETLKAAQRLFWLNCENSAYVGVIYNNSTTSTTRQFSTYYGGSSQAVSGKTLAFSAGRYTLFFTPKRFGWGDNSWTFTKGANAPSTPLVIGSNTSHTGTPYTGRMRTFFVYASDAQDATSASDLENYTPAYTLKPCEYNGEAGLWCVETSKFYGNSAGAGNLSVANIS